MKYLRKVNSKKYTFLSSQLCSSKVETYYKKNLRNQVTQEMLYLRCLGLRNFTA